ncbi:MAG: FAD-dependent oxidoreductase [Lachnospiraceae bacterium]|nr:FAD-dependent oxidoreductase [Lachnospiraceae bacterium]
MESIWKETTALSGFPELDKDVNTEVLIIGGGMAGILTAYFLQQEGVNYILVEKDRICSGTTGNTTAKITVQHGLIYQKILKASGIEAAQKYFQANQKAFESYEQLCQNIACDYEKKDNYVYAAEDRQKLENEMSALAQIGCNAEFCESIAPPVAAVGAVKVPKQAQFAPLKFIASIVKDLNIYENTFVKEMIGNTAVTDRCRIRAEKVIAATHFPFLNKHGSYFLKLYQHRSYVIALENAQNVDGMYVAENKKGMSFRNYKEMLLVGGGGHRTGKQGGSWEELQCFAKRYFPNSREISHWAAQDCMSLDQIPYIGRYSKHTPNLYVASGFNKWGMTGSMVAAMLLCDKILNRENDYADIFDPSRSILKPQLLANGLESVKNLLTPAIPRCPHLGCALKWNPIEHSWDCACHGSRFSKDGRVLDNPANGDSRSVKNE